jgi:hypothetical protein
MKDLSREKRNEFIREIIAQKKATPKEVMDIFDLTRGGLWFILKRKGKKALDKDKFVCYTGIIKN